MLTFDPAVAVALIHCGLRDDDTHDRSPGVEKLRGISGGTLPQQFQKRVGGDLLSGALIRNDAVSQRGVIAEGEARSTTTR